MDDVERFCVPVSEHLDSVVAELEAGRKRTHWMWFMFPQLRGLGESPSAQRYGIEGLDEATRYLRHGTLGSTYERLVATLHRVIVVEGHRVRDVFGSPDDAKLVSSLTLFAAAANSEGWVSLAEHCDDLLAATLSEGLPACAFTTAVLATAN